MRPALLVVVPDDADAPGINAHPLAAGSDAGAVPTTGQLDT
jgi:hypothetical protein